MPSFDSSAWIFRARHRFSVAIRMIRSPASSEIGGRPGAGVDIDRPSWRKPCRCHRTTVSGRTRTSGPFQRGQSRGSMARNESESRDPAGVSIEDGERGPGGKPNEISDDEYRERTGPKITTTPGNSRERWVAAWTIRTRSAGTEPSATRRRMTCTTAVSERSQRIEHGSTA